MIKDLLSKKWVKAALFCVIAFLAGGINGFVGTGGGILLVFGISGVFKADKKDTFATSLCITVPISAIALFNYWRGNKISFNLLGNMWLPVLLGGIAGAFLVDKLKISWLNAIFAVLVIYAGACLIFK